MSTTISIPLLSMSMSEGKIVEWLVDDGATVKEGQPLYSIETEKSVVEIEAPASGLFKRKVEAGSTHPVGTPIGEIS